jgi:hypothetical protein
VLEVSVHAPVGDWSIFRPTGALLPRKPGPKTWTCPLSRPLMTADEFDELVAPDRVTRLGSDKPLPPLAADGVEVFY